MDDKAKPQPRVSTANLGVTPASGGYSAAGGGTPSWRSGPSPSPTPPVAGMTPTTPLPPPTNLAPRALTERESQLVKHLSRLQFFLATAPTRWMGTDDGGMKGTSPFPSNSLSSPHPNLNRFLLPNGEHVACVFWNGLYHITGTDIVRALVFRFEAFSRPVRNIKKFEEGVFSDLRNLKPGTDACLEEPKSPFLDLLFRNGCIRTQKKQKVFYWFSVPHDRLFLDALERDLKREKMGLEATTVVVGEPARSFRYDPKRSLFEQFAGKQPGLEESISTNPRIVDVNAPQALPSTNDPTASRSSVFEATVDNLSQFSPGSLTKDSDTAAALAEDHAAQSPPSDPDRDRLSCPTTANTVLFSRSLLKGSPAYKQGRRKPSKDKKNRHHRGGTATTDYDSCDEGSGSDSDRFPRSDYTFANTLDDNSTQPSFIAPPPMFANARSPPLPFPAPVLNQPTSLASVTAAIASSIPSSGSFPVQRPDSASWTSVMVTHKPEDRLPPLPGYPPVHIAAQSVQQPLSAQIPGSSGSTGPPKGFSCPLLSCGRLFKRLEHLKRHVRTHTQERPYECTRCAKRFSRSDNLTQHIKTHEKADRGERMKTEASESNEEDIATLLEAEVDAMAAREGRSYSISGDVTVGGDDRYGSGYSENAARLQNHFSPARLPMLPPAFSGVGEIATQHAPPGIQTSQGSTGRMDWPGVGPFGAPTLNSIGNDSYMTKRHRSMTPNLPTSNRGSLGHQVGHLNASPYLGATRFHPYGSGTSITAAPQFFTRAASLDPAAFQNRGTSSYEPYSSTQSVQASQDSLRALTTKNSNDFGVFDSASDYTGQHS